MSRITVVGDGPAGLSAALFLVRSGHEVVVVGSDQTPMHYAELHNYLGLEAMEGPQFQERARRQVADAGATLLEGEVKTLAADGEVFTAVVDGGTAVRSEYLILAAGKGGTDLAQHLGIDTPAEGVAVDRQCRTVVERVYAVGRLVRPARSQAIISAGAGAVAALDIMAREAGQDVTDWDSLPTA